MQSKEKTSEWVSESSERAMNTKEEPQISNNKNKTSSASSHTLVGFTIFLSFNAAVKKVTQLLPVYRQNARFFYIKRFNFFFFFLAFFFVSCCIFQFFSSFHRQKIVFSFFWVHVFAFCIMRQCRGRSGDECGEGCTLLSLLLLRLHLFFLTQIKINCWDFHEEWKVSERTLCPFITASTSSHCPINLFFSSRRSSFVGLSLSSLSLSASLWVLHSTL